LPPGVSTSPETPGEKPPMLHVHGLITTEDGIPVPDVEIGVHCSHTRNQPAAHIVVTDTAGRYAYDLPVRRVGYWVTISLAGFVGVEDSVGARGAGEFQRNYRLERPAGSLRGTVYDDEQKPVPGAHISLHRYSLDSQRLAHNTLANAHLDSSWSTTSLADGSFLLKDLPAGSFSLSASFGADYRAQPEKVELRGDVVRDLKLTRGRRVWFRIVDERGLPVQGVNLYPIGSGYSSSGFQDGRHFFVVDGAQDRPSRYLFAADGFEPKEVEIDPRSTESPDVVLAAGLLLSGRVLDENGAAISGLAFDLQYEWRTTNPAQGNRPHRIGYGGAHPETKEDGSFQCLVPGYPSDKLGIQIQVRQPGFVGQMLSLTESDVRSGVTVTVKRPAGAITGQVLSPEGRPLKAFQVSASRPLGEHGAEPGTRLFSFATISDGEGHFTLQDLPEGEVEVSVMSNDGGQLMSGRMRVTVTKGVATPPVIIRCERRSPYPR